MPSDLTATEEEMFIKLKIRDLECSRDNATDFVCSFYTYVKSNVFLGLCNPMNFLEAKCVALSRDHATIRINNIYSLSIYTENTVARFSRDISRDNRKSASRRDIFSGVL